MTIHVQARSRLKKKGRGNIPAARINQDAADQTPYPSILGNQVAIPGKNVMISTHRVSVPT